MDNFRSRAELYILVVYISCFAVGVVTHGIDFARLGWRPYQWGPPLMETFWTALIFLDSIVILLLVLGKRRSGLLLALAIMTLDVAANSYAHFVIQIPGFSVPLLLQTGFLGFILGSVAFVWPGKTEVRSTS